MPEVQILNAPNRHSLSSPTVFLAGSMSTEWQSHLVSRIAQSALIRERVTFIDPRRRDWDSSWVEEYTEPQFREEVDWELDHLELADIVVMNYDPEAKAPVALLELGLMARSGKLVVCCPKGFWKRGNVQAVCVRYGLPLVESLENLESVLLEKLQEIIAKAE
ncbi:hypothetical protein BJ742DRAFT_830323 [Cladochytrium replicatum]|nr:hypothetical protein BJ742DRAFT_830323 [Cladochytrium replicatum]